MLHLPSKADEPFAKDGYRSAHSLVEQGSAPDDALMLESMRLAENPESLQMGEPESKPTMTTITNPYPCAGFANPATTDGIGKMRPSHCGKEVNKEAQPLQARGALRNLKFG